MNTNLTFRTSILYILFVSLFVASCSTSQNSQNTSQNQSNDQTVVGEVAGEDITLSELRENYQTSSPVQSLEEDDLSEFLPVYLNYRAKLKEAEKAGYYNDPGIKKEYNNYAEQAAYSYWMDRVILDELLNEFKQRNKKEIKAVHILKRLTGQASPKDTLKAYNDLMRARKEYLNGAPFDSLIREYSSEQKGRPMGGEIGYFSAGNTIKEFEDVAYEMPVDSISMPVRSRYGYHLILVKDKRKRNRDRKVSHIFFSAKNQKNISPRVKANNAYEALEKGIAWEEAVNKFTDDRASKQKGGTIGWINHGRLDPAFVDSIMAIDSVGTYSNPIQSKYGYHILRIDSVRTFSSDSAERQFLMSKLKKLPRYKNRKEIVHQKLAKLGNAKTYTENLKDFTTHVIQQDTLKIAKITISDSLASLPAYHINGKKYTLGQFYNWLREKHGKTSGNRFRAQWFDDYKLEAITDHIIPLTKKRFPKFKNKIKNYMDGLVVFQITQDSVWNHAQADTARLKNIYKTHPDSFRYDKRYHYYLFMSKSDSLLQEAIDGFQQGTHPDTLDNKLKGLSIRTDSTSYIDDFPFSKLSNMETGSFSNLLKYKNRRAYLYLEKILPPRKMTFDEAYNRLVSYYQPIREKEWMQSLRDRYNVRIYEDRLDRKLQTSSQ